MAEFVHTILEFLETNHFTNAEAALRSELMTRLSSNGSGSLSLSDDLKQESGARHNEICNGGRGSEWRDAGYMHIKNDRPYHLNRGTSFENGMEGLQDEAEKSRSFPFSHKAMLNKPRNSELLVKELGCYSSKYEPSGERRYQNTEQAVSEAKQMPASEDDYADEAWVCSKNSFEPKQLQDSAGAREDSFMFQKDNMLSEKKSDYNSSEEQVLVLNAVSNEVVESEERLRNTSGQAKDKFYETQKGEILDEGSLGIHYPSRKRHSTKEWKAGIDPVSRVDGDSHASVKGDGSLKLQGGQNSLSGHDEKTCSQVAGAMLEGELNIKEEAHSNQGSEHFVKEVSADEGAQNIAYFQEYFGQNRGFKSTVQSQNPFSPWKEGSFQTVIPFPLGENSVNDDQLFENQVLEKVVNEHQQGIRQKGTKGSKITEEEIDKEGASMQVFDHQGSPEQEKVERSTPLQIGENILNVSQERFDAGRIMNSIGSQTKRMDMETSFSLGPYFNAPAGKEIRPSGRELTIGSHQLSPIQTIDGDASELVFADGLRSFVDCPTEQWDFDEYDDDDDLGYIRKPVEDEAWILAHEMDYLNNNVQRRYEHRTTPIQKDNNAKKNQDENLSFVENLYFLGEQSNDIEPKAVSQDLFGLCTANLYGKRDYSGLADRHDGQLVGDGEKNLMLVSSEWQGFAMQSNGVEMLSSEEIPSNDQQPRENIFWVDDDQHQLVRSTFLKNYDIEDAGTDLRGSFVVLSSEAVGIDGSKPVKYDQSSSSHSSLDRAEEVRERQEPENDKMVRYESDSWRDHTAIYECQAGKSELEKGFIKDDLKERHNELYSQNPYSRSLDFEGFSFPNPSGTGDMVEFKVEPGKPLWSTNMNSIVFEGTNVYGHAMVGPDVQIPPRKKSNGSSPIASQRDGDLNVVCPMHLTTSTLGSTERIINKGENFNDIDDGDVGVIEDEEAVALQEQVQQIKAQEDEFETFDLQIVHRRNRTGFEEDKNYHVDLNSVIAGHYHVIEKLGSASFSNAVQARDLHTGMDVCLKIIKNNKEFFDQSLDEIKLLKFVNRHDPADKYHILRLYNYFYYHEHLFIVCELLKANLYEFNKFNRESGGEVYFTMPRIQSVAIQCLEALQFLHNLGLIHCDLKPENILVKSYSRCEVKVIDLGSSCFETDHLCPYVQSRSYRAPEVILGLPYDKRIDIWSLGCILAELCSGNVLFQNESSATLLARIIGIVGPIKAEMLDMGHNTHKYFTKNYVLYEQNKDTNRLELLMPKKTSLRHRLSMGDEGFIDFVSYLLEINPKKRPTASEALQHPWLSYPYEPISS